MAREARRAGGRARIANAAALSPLSHSPGSSATAGGAGAGAGIGALAEGELAVAAAAPALDGDNLVVEGAEVEAGLGPCGEVIRDGDGAAGAGALPDGDVLVEGGGALDGGLVDLLVLPDRVGGAIAREGALLRALLWIADRVLHDVVLDQRVRTPTVDRQQADP